MGSCGTSKAALAPPSASKQKGQSQKLAAYRPQSFQVKLDNAWTDYSNNENMIITCAFLRGQPHCRFTMCGTEVAYSIDFRHMCQTNLATGKVREVRAPPGMKQPKATTSAPPSSEGPMVVMVVKPGQAGTAVMVADPSNYGQQVQVNVPSNAAVGSKLNVPLTANAGKKLLQPFDEGAMKPTGSGGGKVVVGLAEDAAEWGSDGTASDDTAAW
eukprot:CAMPEP_0178403340 /NCGR_PEP_ID=MMETSP0689_2-20121128/17316_1 /TAXON_ID=160604 /ORGANISM="Amphidinium massartii, Strain CS-259" /LENGTH=213 /DNA_ID=CAMNT_0020024287 /DNA_START=84 /DNA_END=722 /DNA_ORIENTATION=-